MARAVISPVGFEAVIIILGKRLCADDHFPMGVKVPLQLEMTFPALKVTVRQVTETPAGVWMRPFDLSSWAVSVHIERPFRWR